MKLFEQEIPTAGIPRVMTRENEILQYLHYHPDSSRNDIEAGLRLSVSPATLKRILAALVENGSAIVAGQCISSGACSVADINRAKRLN